MRRMLVCVLAAACGRTSPAAGPAAPASLSNKVVGPTSELTITRTHVGPIDAATPATLLGLRRALPGFEVRPANDDELEFRIFQAGEQLAYVVPASGRATIFNVHATSPRVGVEGRDWRVGAPLRDAAPLTTCECWGDHATCFQTGEHVAVSFAPPCRSPRAELQALEGRPIQRIIWSPSPFGEPVDDATVPAGAP